MVSDEMKKKIMRRKYKDLVQVLDEDTGLYIKIDRASRTIVGRKKSKGAYKNIPIVENLKVIGDDILDVSGIDEINDFYNEEEEEEKEITIEHVVEEEEEEEKEEVKEEPKKEHAPKVIVTSSLAEAERAHKEGMKVVPIITTIDKIKTKVYKIYH